jgi:Tol biopolymer transport system component
LEPAFSPDGRWIAYTSNESGRNEIYVQPFPAEGSSGTGRWQISGGGGRLAVWSRASHELFYDSPDNRIMVVPCRAEGDSFVPEKPSPVRSSSIFRWAGTWIWRRMANDL